MKKLLSRIFKREISTEDKKHNKVIYCEIDGEVEICDYCKNPIPVGEDLFFEDFEPKKQLSCADCCDKHNLLKKWIPLHEEKSNQTVHRF